MRRLASEQRKCRQVDSLMGSFGTLVDWQVGYEQHFCLLVAGVEVEQLSRKSEAGRQRLSVRRGHAGYKIQDCKMQIAGCGLQGRRSRTANGEQGQAGEQLVRSYVLVLYVGRRRSEGRP